MPEEDHIKPAQILSIRTNDGQFFDFRRQPDAVIDGEEVREIVRISNEGEVFVRSDATIDELKFVLARMAQTLIRFKKKFGDDLS